MICVKLLCAKSTRNATMRNSRSKESKDKTIVRTSKVQDEWDQQQQRHKPCWKGSRGVGKLLFIRICIPNCLDYSSFSPPPLQYCGPLHGTRKGMFWNRAHLDLKPISSSYQWPLVRVGQITLPFLSFSFLFNRKVPLTPKQKIVITNEITSNMSC